MNLNKSPTSAGGNPSFKGASAASHEPSPALAPQAAQSSRRARGPGPDEKGQLNSADLLRYRQPELEKIYAQLPAPERGSADGVWRGRLMAFTGFGWLPRWLAAALYRLLALPINPWRGKGFDGDQGANRWFGMPGVGYAFYNLKFINSPVDGRPAVCLDYDRKDNLGLLRHIRGEGRVLGDGEMLCRMFWKTRSGLHLVLYFTLTRAG